MNIELIINGKVDQEIPRVATVESDLDIYLHQVFRFKIQDDSKWYVVPDEYEVRITGDNAVVKMMKNGEVFREFKKLDELRSHTRPNGTGWASFTVKDTAKEFFCQTGKAIEWWNLRLEEV